jgi:hypothetical protein
VCFPLDTLRTRMMAPGAHHRYGGPVATFRGIARYEGLGALYAGCVPAVVGMAPAGAVFYGVYDVLKSRHLRGMAAEGERRSGQQAAAAAKGAGGLQGGRPALELPAGYMLLYGAIAGVASEVCVYPLEVLRRRMQLQSAPGAGGGAAGAAAAAMLRGSAAGGHAASVSAWRAHSSAAWGRIAMAAASIWREGGAAGFYTGLRPSLLQVLPSAALSYWVSAPAPAGAGGGGEVQARQPTPRRAGVPGGGGARARARTRSKRAPSPRSWRRLTASTGACLVAWARPRLPLRALPAPSSASLAPRPDRALNTAPPSRAPHRFTSL